MRGTSTAATPAGNGLSRIAGVLRRFGPAAVVLTFIALAGAALTGGFTALDDGLRDLRFAAAPRSPTGSIVVADIDSPSLKAI
ncbi:MAG TPA: hypothetical protein VFE64_03970, partial [Devosia sp.]|nr:hypothetical protein [Devosia sp.]